MKWGLIFVIIGALGTIIGGLVQNESFMDNIFGKPSEATDPQKIISTPNPTPSPTTTDEDVQVSTQSPIASSEKSYQQWWSEGDQLYSEGDFLGAIDCYNNAIELSPDNAELWNAKGYAFREMAERYQTDGNSEQAKGEYEQAIIAFDKALELSNFNFQDAQDGKDYCEKQLDSLY